MSSYNARTYSPAGPSRTQGGVSQSARPGEIKHIDDVETQLPRQDVLTGPPATTNRQPSHASPVLRTQPQVQPYLGPAVNIYPYQNTYTNYDSHDVPLPLRDVASRLPFVNLQDALRPRLDSSFPSSYPAVHHVQLNTSSIRPRTSLPDFEPAKLAAHYGIPTKLPPAPSVINNNNNNNKPPLPNYHNTQFNSVESPQASTSSYPISLVSGYLNMLENKGSDNDNTVAPAVPRVLTSSTIGMSYAAEPTIEEAAQNIVHSMMSGMSPIRRRAISPILNALSVKGATVTAPVTASEELPSSVWTEFLTSPYADDDTPFENWLETPQHDNGPDSFMTSPVLTGNMSLFGGGCYYDEQASDVAKVAISGIPPDNVFSTPSVQLEGLYSMPPETPALEPSSLESPLVQDLEGSSPSPFVPRNKSKEPTGTRKNVTPDSLIPVDAPTQTHKYALPSTTSRKELPAVFARKRARSVAFADEEDELVDETPSTSERAAIEAKRRQNTMAARRSRMRKLEHQRELEDTLATERRDKEMWRERAMMLRSQMMSLGYPEPFREDA